MNPAKNGMIASASPTTRTIARRTRSRPVGACAPAGASGACPASGRPSSRRARSTRRRRASPPMPEQRSDEPVGTYPAEKRTDQRDDGARGHVKISTARKASIASATRAAADPGIGGGSARGGRPMRPLRSETASVRERRRRPLRRDLPSGARSRVAPRGSRRSPAEHAASRRSGGPRPRGHACAGCRAPASRASRARRSRRAPWRSVRAPDAERATGPASRERPGQRLVDDARGLRRGDDVVRRVLEPPPPGAGRHAGRVERGSPRRVGQPGALLVAGSRPRVCALGAAAAIVLEARRRPRDRG